MASRYDCKLSPPCFLSAQSTNFLSSMPCLDLSMPPCLHASCTPPCLHVTMSPCHCVSMPCCHQPPCLIPSLYAYVLHDVSMVPSCCLLHVSMPLCLHALSPPCLNATLPQCHHLYHSSSCLLQHASSSTSPHDWLGPGGPCQILRGSRQDYPLQVEVRGVRHIIYIGISTNWW